MVAVGVAILSVVFMMIPIAADIISISISISIIANTLDWIDMMVYQGFGFVWVGLIGNRKSIVAHYTERHS